MYKLVSIGIYIKQNLLIFTLPLLFISAPLALSDTNQPTSGELEKSADTIFSESKKMFNDTQYWECSRNLILILDTYPDYSDIDHVVYMLGECLYEAEMLEGSRRMFEFFISKYVSSTYLPYALAGIQRNHFEMGRYQESIDIYNIIVQGKPESELLDYVHYYAGLAHYYNKQYNEAIETLALVRENYPYSDFAQYTSGLAMLKAEKVREAIDVFHNICKLPVYNQERQRIVNEAHLTLGFLYYEMGYYQHSLKEFNKISSEYDNYATVLLSAGWAATKMENYKEAIIYLTDFISNYQENPDTPQGLFLLGRCYLKLGYFEEALKSYDYLIEILPAQNVLPGTFDNINIFLTDQLEEIEKIKMDILLLESKFVDMSLNLDGDIPEYMIKEKDRVQTQRYTLLERIRTERETLNALTEKIETVQVMASSKDEQREWRAYAEYGRSRAMYLYKQKNLP